MLAKNEGKSLADAVNGPVGTIGLIIVVIALVVFAADNIVPKQTAPDKSILFAGIIKDLIVEIRYYIYTIIPLGIIGGAVMMMIQLIVRFSPPKHLQPAGG